MRYKNFTLMRIYLLWIVIFFIITIISFASSMTELSALEITIRFVGKFILLGIGALLVYFVEKDKYWAKLLFTYFCLAHFFLTILALLIQSSYAQPIEWICSIIIISGWGFLTFQIIKRLPQVAALRTSYRNVTFTDIGPIAGNCLLCGREVYAVPGFITAMLVQTNDPEGKIMHSARWCPRCGNLYCLSCTVSTLSNTECPKCNIKLVDQYH